MQLNPRSGLFSLYRVQISLHLSGCFKKNWEMAQDKSERIKNMFTLTQKQQQIQESYLCHFISDTSGFYGLLCTWHRTTPGFNDESVRLSCLLSHKFSPRGRTSVSSAFSLVCCVRTSYISTSTSTILPLIISSEPCWCLNLRQRVIGLLHTHPHLARPGGGEPGHQFVFSRSQVVWSLFPFAGL